MLLFRAGTSADMRRYVSISCNQKIYMIQEDITMKKLVPSQSFSHCCLLHRMWTATVEAIQKVMTREIDKFISSITNEAE